MASVKSFLTGLWGLMQASRTIANRGYCRRMRGRALLQRGVEQKVDSNGGGRGSLEGTEAVQASQIPDSKDARVLSFP